MTPAAKLAEMIEDLLPEDQDKVEEYISLLNLKKSTLPTNETESDMSTRICFFSSDAAPLYKRAIFHKMILPNGYVTHFRYEKRHLPENMVDLLKKSKGKEGISFFTVGNDQKIPIGERTTSDIPVRRVKIVNVIDEEETEEKKTETGLVHVYLELKEFVKCSSNSIHAIPQKPGRSRFVEEIEVANEEVVPWHKKVEELKPHFLGELFYKIEIFNNNGKKTLAPVYSDIRNESHYELMDESEYILEISFFDVLFTEISFDKNSTQDHQHLISQKLIIESEKKSKLQLNIPREIEVGARRDRERYRLNVESIRYKTDFSYLYFRRSPAYGSLELDLELPILINKDWKRIFKFSFFTILTGFGGGLGKIALDKIDINGQFDFHLAGLLTLATIFGIFGLFKLYQLFDKK
jgi:hypothetical protein